MYKKFWINTLVKESFIHGDKVCYQYQCTFENHNVSPRNSIEVIEIQALNYAIYLLEHYQAYLNRRDARQAELFDTIEYFLKQLEGAT